MKNADMPAMPLFNSNGSPVHHSSAGMENHGVMAGLTKREMMAMHALQGLLAAPDLNTAEPDAVAGAAIAYVDALLAALEVSA